MIPSRHKIYSLWTFSKIWSYSVLVNEISSPDKQMMEKELCTFLCFLQASYAYQELQDLQMHSKPDDWYRHYLSNLFFIMHFSFHKHHLLFFSFYFLLALFIHIQFLKQPPKKQGLSHFTCGWRSATLLFV